MTRSPFALLPVLLLTTLALAGAACGETPPPKPPETPAEMPDAGETTEPAPEEPQQNEEPSDEEPTP